MGRRTLSVLVGLSATFGLAALALRNVQLPELWAALAGARWAWLPPMAAISLFDIWIRARRWKILLSRSGAVASVSELYRLEAMGLGVNNVLFMRLGELARSFLASREFKIPLATVLASVAVERILDVCALLTLFVVASAGAPEIVPGYVRHAAFLALGGAVGALALLAVAEGWLKPGGWAEAKLRPWPRAHSLTEQLADGAAVLRSPSAALKSIALGLLLWACDAFYYWMGARALSIGFAVTYPRAILILSWAGAGAALPAAPGSFGTFEAVVKSIVVSFGVPPDAALAYAVFTHMLGYALVTAMGLIFLYRVGLSLTELRAALENKKPGAPA